jgi:NDP-sugar pyrophosphorylase family protein
LRAIILAGGKGTRLLPFTLSIPKPLVPIGDLPILEILIRQLKHQGFERLTISVGHLASLIEAFCGRGERWGVPIDYLFEEEPLGTIGCLGLAMDLDAHDRILVVNGDTLTDLSMADAYSAHSPEDAITICARNRSVHVEFGVLESDGEYLKSYLEKPTLSYLVSMGVSTISSWAIAQYITPGERLDMPEFVGRLLQAGERVRVQETSSYWLDLGRMTDLETGQKVIQSEPGRFIPP